jgi:hypothetical protein
MSRRPVESRLGLAARFAGAVILVSSAALGPQVSTASVYSLDPRSVNPLFWFERRAQSTGTQTVVDVWFRTADGETALHERVIYERENVIQYDSFEYQIDEHYAMRRAGGRVSFLVTRGNNVTRSSDRWTDETRIIDEIPDYIRKHWSALLAGETLQIRFVVMFRGEIIPFQIYKQATIDQNGTLAVVIRLRPSNWIIARFVRPVDLLFRSDERRTLVEMTGPLPVKIQRGSKWVDLDGRLALNPSS